MNKIFAMLLLSICVCFCACENSEETKASIISPTASASTKPANTEPVNTEQPDTEEDVTTSEEPIDTGDLGSSEDLNDFQLLESDNDNTITIDNTLALKLAEKEQSYTIENKHFTRKNQKGELEVEYPQFLGKEKSLKTVNALIYELVDNNVSREDEICPIIDCEISYEVKKASDSIISIVFDCMNSAPTAIHPENKVFTFNYDLKEDKLITLNELTTVETDFLKKCKGTLKKQVEKELYDGILKTNGDLNTLLSNLKGENAVFYFDEDHICVGFTLNAAGNYTDYARFLYNK